MYKAPSAPMAAPVRPPPVTATISLRQLPQVRVSRPALISTTITDPSGMTTGPSGYARPSATTSKCIDLVLERRNRLFHDEHANAVKIEVTLVFDLRLRRSI